MEVGTSSRSVVFSIIWLLQPWYIHLSRRLSKPQSQSRYKGRKGEYFYLFWGLNPCNLDILAQKLAKKISP
jgi:hypothetical protein